MSPDTPVGADERPPVRREGGRSARVRAAVFAAAAELIAEGGAERLSIPAVAARAGVNPTTVYRRWGDAAGLLRDVTANRLAPHDPPPDTGTLRGDLSAWAAQTLGTITTTEGLALLRGSVACAATSEGPSPRMAARESQLAAILARAAERGDPHPTLRQTLDYLLAPLYLRVLLNLAPADTDYADTLVDDLVRHYAKPA